MHVDELRDGEHLQHERDALRVRLLDELRHQPPLLPAQRDDGPFLRLHLERGLRGRPDLQHRHGPLRVAR